MGGGGKFFFLKIMTLRTFVFQFKCSSALSLPVCTPTATFFFCFPSPFLPTSLVKVVRSLVPPWVTPASLLFFSLWQLQYMVLFGENETNGASPCVPGVVPAAPGRGLSLGCSRVFLSRHLFFPNVPFLPCPPSFLFSFD